MATNDKYSDIYNKAYSFVTPDFLEPENERVLKTYLKQNNESLYQFINDFFSDKGGLDYLAGKEVLETGCGLGGVSHFLASKNAKTLGIDISPLAISGAKEVALQRDSSADFKTADLTSGLSLGKKFDYIIDSHLLHCLSSTEQREAYFKFIKEHLNPDGYFMVETATFDDEIREPLGYSINQDYILHQEIDNESIPVRKLSTALQLENELTANALKINTFYYHYELSFNIFPEIKNYPSFRLPKTVRYTAKLG